MNTLQECLPRPLHFSRSLTISLHHCAPVLSTPSRTSSHLFLELFQNLFTVVDFFFFLLNSLLTYLIYHSRFSVARVSKTSKPLSFCEVHDRRHSKLLFFLRFIVRVSSRRSCIIITQVYPRNGGRHNIINSFSDDLSFLLVIY